jgi:tetratricopeptide (TPR) repeat protein
MGSCYASQGRFTEALPSCERAIIAKAKGDVHGRVDAASVGASLHQVGYCHASQGKFAQALPWFEQAITAKEKGDVRGRVDHASLETSRREVERCHARLEKRDKPRS